MSLRGYKTCQWFSMEFGHVFVVPMENKTGKNIALAIKRYFREKAVPEHLIWDQAREKVRGDAKIICHDSGFTIVELEKGILVANRAERTIKILKDSARKEMFAADSPLVL